MTKIDHQHEKWQKSVKIHQNQKSSKSEKMKKHEKWQKSENQNRQKVIKQKSEKVTKIVKKGGVPQNSQNVR